MAKILTDKEMADIVQRAVSDPALVECSDSYRHFLEGLGDLICTHFGGERGNVSFGDGDGLGWTCGFHVNECVPDDGGVFKTYDTGVRWVEGKEGCGS